MTNATSFGANAQNYKAHRPLYPGALFDWIAAEAPAHDLAWDCATGAGQAAGALATRFRRVIATDVSAEQIAVADGPPNVSFAVSPAAPATLGDGTADAITVATALHWFYGTPFWKECRRVGKPGAFFAAWAYKIFTLNEESNALYLKPTLDLIDPFWASGNRLAMAGYTAEAVAFPFEVTAAPDFNETHMWPFKRIAGFARTWSAYTPRATGPRTRNQAARNRGKRPACVGRCVVAGDYPHHSHRRSFKRAGLTRLRFPAFRFRAISGL
ncbi:MAG: class I SAM-dependent methyltransferase [Pseudomonadota bacterium]